MGSTGRRRTGIILILLILVVLVIGAGGLFLLQMVGRGAGEGEAAAEGGVEAQVEATPTPTSTVNIIVAARQIPRGARLTVQDVRVQEWPLSVDPPLGALFVGEQADAAGLEQVEGRIARVDILDGQPILDFMLTPGDQPTDLAEIGSDAALLTPSGTVVIAMPITRLSAVGYALRPGDHVDILMSYQFVQVDEEFQTLLPNRGIILTDNPELAAALQVQGTDLVVGREEPGPFGSTLLVIPNTEATGGMLPTRTTQLVIDNAIVMQVGNWPIADLEQPIVVTPAPQPTQAATEGQGGEEAAPPEGAEPTPTPLPAVPVPDIISLAMSRQDALVLKYSLEVGADITLVLRSVLDNDVANVQTDPVTLEYITTFYNVQVPPSLPYALDPRINMLDFLDTFGGTAGAGGAETADQAAQE